MRHITVGRKYNEGKVAKIECVRNDRLQNIDIKDKCFLLIILTAGKLEFKVENEQFCTAAPAFICFDETQNPVLISKRKAQYTCIYFHPEFLNVNMSFELLRKKEYVDIASTHDLFLLKPFTDKAYVIPITEAPLDKITQAAEFMQEELQNQRDWYWSCRGRSYFMEIIRHDALCRGSAQPRKDEGQRLPRQRAAHHEQKTDLQQPERAVRQDRPVPQQGPDHRGQLLPDDGRGQDVPAAVFGRAAQRRQHVQHRPHPLARLLRCRDADVGVQRGSAVGRTGRERRRGREGPRVPCHDHRKPDTGVSAVYAQPLKFGQNQRNARQGIVAGRVIFL